MRPEHLPNSVRGALGSPRAGVLALRLFSCNNATTPPQCIGAAFIWRRSQIATALSLEAYQGALHIQRIWKHTMQRLTLRHPGVARLGQRLFVHLTRRYSGSSASSAPSASTITVPLYTSASSLTAVNMPRLRAWMIYSRTHRRRSLYS